MTDNTDVSYDDNDYRDDGLLPTDTVHNEMPLSDNDKQIVSSLNAFFDNAWIH